MRICEATNLRINELRKQRRLTEYALIYQTGMPPSTVSCTEKVKIPAL